MAQSLGTIYVDLQAQTGGFVSALSKAAAEAQKFSKEFANTFRDIGERAEQTFGAFGQLNPLISKLGLAFSTAGNAASNAMKEFSKLPGVLGPLAAFGVGGAAGAASLGIGAIAIVASAAESSAKMLELARSTGVSVEALSSLSFAARQSDVDQEVLVKSLQFLSANMVKAATSAKGTKTAFSRLGLDIRDDSGNLKDAGKFYVELIGRLTELKDKTAAVGLARQTLGRGGAANLAFGSADEIQKWIDLQKALGTTATTQGAEAAHKFEQSLGLIGEAAKGLTIQLKSELLPSLQGVIDYMTKDLAQGPDSGIRKIITAIADLTKQMLGLANMAIFTFKVLNAGVNAVGSTFTNPLAEFKKYLKEVEDSHDSAAVKAAKIANASVNLSFQEITGTGGKYTGKQFEDYVAQAKKDAEGLSDAIFHPPAPKLEKEKPFGGAADLEATEKFRSTASARIDTVAQLIAKLEAQAQAELALASATEKSVAATVLAKAAAQAEEKIAETRSHLFQEQLALIDKLAEARAGAAKGDQNGAEQALRFENEIGAIQHLVEELDKATPQIKALYAEIAAAGFGAKASEDLQKFITKTDEETAALRQMAAAYGQGPLAAQRAQDAAKIAPFQKQHENLGELITGLRTAGAPEADIAKLQTAYDQLGASIIRAARSALDLTSAEISEKIAKEKEQLGAEAEAYGVVAAAALKSSQAQREAAAQAETIKFGAEHPTATAEQLKEVYSVALEKQQQLRAETVAITAAQYSLNASYAQEIEKLEEARNLLISMGESTLLVDARMQEAANNAAREWDRAASSVGSLTEKFRAMVNEIELQGNNLGEKVFGSFSHAVDGISGELAKLVVTGKSNFQQLFQSIAEEILKAGIQKTISAAFGKIFGGPSTGGGNGPGGTPPFLPAGESGGGVLSTIGSVFGLGGLAKGGRPDGSKGNPLYVVDASAGGGGISSLLGGGSSDSGGGAGGGLGDVLSGLGGKISDGFSSIFSSLSGVLGSIGGGVGSLLSIFGGFLADGGDVTPGKAYIVGERGPEPFFPKQSGRIFPSRSLAMAGGGGGDVHQTMITQNINGVRDFDSFRRSRAQVYADLQHQSAIAHARNRG